LSWQYNFIQARSLKLFLALSSQVVFE
jgi:hypothetical protein